MIDLKAYLAVMRDEFASEISTITELEVDAVLTAESITPHDFNLLRIVAGSLQLANTHKQDIPVEEVDKLVDIGVIVKDKTGKHYSPSTKGWMVLDLYMDSNTYTMIKGKDFTRFFTTVKEEIGRVQSRIRPLVLSVPDTKVPSSDIKIVANAIKLFF